jgi:DNA primase
VLYPQHFIDELASRADIVRIIGDYVQLKKKGQNHMACCPFHDEKTPSFSVNANKGFYKCFGCGKGGNIFTFLMELEGLAFPEAVREVAEKSGVPLPEPIDDENYAASKKKRDDKERSKKKVIELNSIALEFWESYLEDDNPQSEEARKYLESRELDQETIERFRIGFAPDSWDTIFNLLKEKGFDEKLIRESGLVTVNEEKKSVYDRFRGRIIFPVLDINGDPVAFGARILGKGEPKYLNSPETPAYIKGDHLYGLHQNKDEVRRQKYGILVEGYLDLIALYQFGVKNCVASLGTALTPKQAKLLGRFARKVAVNYDGDSAGIKAAKRAIETFLTQDFEIKVLVLPDGKDPDDFIRSEGFEAYKDQHRNHALPYLQFVLESIVRERNVTLPKQKAAAIEDALPVLVAVRNTVEKRETLKHVLRYFQINDRILEDHVWKEICKRSDRIYSDQADARSDEKITRLVMRQSAAKITVAEQKLLELLIHDVELRKIILPQLEPTDYEPLGTALIFESLLQLEKDEIENPGPLLLEMTKDDETAHELVPTLLMSDSHRDKDEAIDEVLHAAENCAARLRSMAVDRRILEISQELAFAEQNNDSLKLNKLVSEQIELARLKRDIEDRLQSVSE